MTKIHRRHFLAGTAASLATPRVLRAQGADIQVGATVPLTGPLAGSGQQYHYSLQMAEDDINAAGGIKGRKLKIVFEDTQVSNSVAVNAFIKLAKDLNPPFIFLSSLSTQNLASEPEVLKAKIPTMYAGGADAIHLRKNPYMFRLRPYDTVTTTAMAKTVIDRVKGKKPAVIYVQDDFGQGSANILEKIFKDAGVNVVAKEAYGGRDNDMSAQLLNIQQAGADVIVGFTYIRDGGLVIGGRTSLGINVPMVTSGATPLPATLALLEPKDLENLYSTTDTFLDESRGGDVAKYVEKFKARFKLNPDPYGSCYYDGAMMLADAMRAVGTDREGIREYLAKIKDWKGVTHTYRSDASGNLAHDIAIIKFKKGTKEMEFVDQFSMS